jgi:hypothetical protein
MHYRMPQSFTTNTKPNLQGGVYRISIRKYGDMAKNTNNFHTETVITTHVFRQSREAHMLQAWINLVYTIWCISLAWIP